MAEVTSTYHRPWTEGRRTGWEEELLKTLLREEGTVQGGERWNEEARHHGVGTADSVGEYSGGPKKKASGERGV